MAWQSSDWLSSARFDTFNYIEVDKDTLEDLREIEEIEETGGSIKYQDLTSLKVSADLPFVGDFNIGNNYIRIYSTSEIYSESITILHGTFIPSRPSTDYSVATATGTIECYSLLLLVEEAKIESPLTIPAGTLGVLKAEELVRDTGLNVIADDSLFRLSNDRNYDAGTSYLEIVNDLLDIAGYNSLSVDSTGNARMTSYTDPAMRAPVWTLRDDESGVVFSPAVTYDFDIFDVPNKVIAVYSSADEDKTDMVAIALNNDPESIYSVKNRGRTIPHIEDVSDVESQAALQAVANRVLISKSSAVESIELEHAYLPYNMGDALRLVYTKHKMDFTGVAVNKELQLKRGMPCKTRIRRFVRM